MTHIIVFGHSIAQGYWDEKGGWVQRLREYLDERYLENKDEDYGDFYYEVFNLGVSGEDSGDILERFEAELKPRVYSEDDIVIFHLGINSTHILPNGEFRKDEDEFRNEIKELVKIANEEVENVLIVGEGYIGDIEYSPGSEKKVKDERLEKFEEIKRDICKKENITYVDIRGSYTREMWKNKLEDGFHPNSDGHRVIYNKLKDSLEQDNLL